MERSESFFTRLLATGSRLQQSLTENNHLSSISINTIRSNDHITVNVNHTLTLPSENSDSALNILLAHMDSSIRMLIETLQQNNDVTKICIIALQYLPFIAFLLLKYFYDHWIGLSVLLFLNLSYAYKNIDLKKRTCERSKHDILYLLLSSFMLLNSIFITLYIYPDIALRLCFLLINDRQMSFLHLIWIIALTDVLVRILMLMFKVIILILPRKHMFIYRKIYFIFIERTSGIYRCLLPIPSWLFYLLKDFGKSEIVFPIFLTVIYIITKIFELFQLCKSWGTIWKYLLYFNSQNFIPTKYQLENIGRECPICQENMSYPIILACNHIFCEDCIINWFNSSRTCPVCRTEISAKFPFLDSRNLFYFPRIF